MMKNLRYEKANYSPILLILSFLMLLLFTGNTYCQTAFSIKNSNDSSYIYIDNNGNVAIDTSTVLSSLTIGGENGIISTGNYGSGSSLGISGAGTRLMWYPKKAAFRVGYVDGTQWDDTNIGNYSFASGYNSYVTGDYGVAIGYSAIAGYSGIALGFQSNANGTCTAIGYQCSSSGSYAIALGNNASSSSASVSIGYKTHGSGDYSTAIGYWATSSGNNSMSIGYYSTSSGNHSIAIGNYVSTSNHAGSFILGDHSSGSTTTNSSADNQMMTRFDGGYIFYTSSDISTYAHLDNGQSAWSTTSDSTKKYAFLPVNGQNVLNKLSKFNLRTWSYKGQDSTKFRHYGPMAQEFFAAFGHDKYGVIGNDTTINSSDFSGINLVAIQALEKRTRELKKAYKELKYKSQRLVDLEEVINKQQLEIEKLKKMKSELINFKNTLNEFMSNDTTNNRITIVSD